MSVELSLDFDGALLTPDYLANPYPYYHALRDKDPVHWSQPMNAWVLMRYEDVHSGLKDPRLTSGQRVSTYASTLPKETRGELQPLFDQLGMWVVNVDPPDHTRLRELVNVVFTPRMVESLRPDIQRVITELLDVVERRGQMDFIRDFAYPLPAIVIAQMLGVPRADRNQFMGWSSDLTAYLGTGQANIDVARAASASAAALQSFFEDLIEQRRANPQTDLLSNLVKLEDEGDTLSRQELLSMCGVLLVAGHETTMALLSNGMLALLRHPDQLKCLQKKPELVTMAVEEMLRYDSPIQHQGRVAVEDFEFEGKQIKAGQRVVLFIGAANRDPAEFPDPDGFDLARSPNKHVAFGYGPHFCIGAPLARLEAQIAFPMIFERFTNLQLATERIEFRKHTSQRNPTSLPLRFENHQSLAINH